MREVQGEEMIGQADGMLYHFGRIAEIFSGQGLNAAFLEEAAAHLAVVKEQLQLTEIQAALFSLILNESAKSEGLTLAELAKCLKCENIEALRHVAEIKRLERRKLVRRVELRLCEGFAWRVPEEVCMALAAGRIPKPKSIKNLTPEKFFELIDRALDQCRIDKKHCLRIANCNMHLALCKTVRGMESLDAMLLLYMCRELVISGSGIISEMKINRFLRNFPYSNRNMVIRKLRGGKHTLVERGFVEFAGNGLFGECAEFSLTKKAREEFLEGLEIYEQDGENKKNLIRWQDICDKELFYNAGESQSIAEITSLFAPESFAAVRRRLEERGRAPGFACLFFGPPGTGKTASVYAIARAAKRDIVQVNIAETKSMWFGKSEKIMKGIFDDYRRIVERRRLKGENIPVLFFNEADAIFSKRLPLGDERNGPAQTENAIQNILLDEMEKIDGILLATTNLTGNFDTAFERRFLYKIEFSKPDSGVRSSIWNTLIPELDNTACAALARKYDFSGGQIDNIA